MAEEPDRTFIVWAINHLKARDESERRSGKESSFAKLAEELRAVTKSAAAPRYSLAARSLENHAASFGVTVGTSDERGLAANIGQHINDLAIGKPRTFAAPLLYWLWSDHRDAAVKVFTAVNFEHEVEYRRAASQRAAGSSQAIVVQQNRSPYSLANLLDEAKGRIVMLAQNHWHMITQPAGTPTDFWRRIEAAIRRGVTVEIVAMHSDAPPPLPHDNPPDPIKLWSFYLKAPAFSDHVDQCWGTLNRFLKEYRKIHDEESYEEDRLKIYRSWFLPMTMTIVDPLLDNGIAVLSPRTASEISGPRHDFILTRRNNLEAFLYFWSFAENLTANQADRMTQTK